ncbi:MAG: hypothetical protein R3Y43_00425 [Alphaproteobacteria bacterium]
MLEFIKRMKDRRKRVKKLLGTKSVSTIFNVVEFLQNKEKR